MIINIYNKIDNYLEWNKEEIYNLLYKYHIY